MPIEFPCPTCRQQVRTPDAAAGKKGRCPNCGTVVVIPAPVAVIMPGSLSVAPTKPQPAPLSPPAAAPAALPAIEFPCPQCHNTVRTPASVAGKKGKCPH